MYTYIYIYMYNILWLPGYLKMQEAIIQKLTVALTT